LWTGWKRLQRFLNPDPAQARGSGFLAGRAGMPRCLPGPEAG
jgi:hypothetical protein